MKAHFFLILMMAFLTLASFGQNINVTFTGAGAATQIDSVTATNLTTNQSVTLPGNETLILTVNTGLFPVSTLTDKGMVYPNPFSGKATFMTMVQEPQIVCLNIQNLVGQVVAQIRTFIQPGEQEFSLAVSDPGIYLVSFSTERGTASYKVICTDATTPENSIRYLGSASDSYHNRENLFETGLKSNQTGYSLAYSPAEIIHYRCKSWIYTTILTDSPATSKNYVVRFAECTDGDGKNYSIVKIDYQTWMAENLAYLPSVSPTKEGSKTDPYYYVYDYQGTSVDDAKATENYSTYGVWYNLSAALTACPPGWHLPSDEEWSTLTDYLGASAGGKMKETGTAHWLNPNTGATNESGFTARPGGLRTDYSGLLNLGDCAYYWTTTNWLRSLTYNNDGLDKSYSWYTSYGASVRCILWQPPAELPTVTTMEVSAITAISASSGGNVTADGGARIIARGVCWAADTDGPTTDHPHTTNGTGNGLFTSDLTGLTSDTRYFVRAYATNSAGTSYGDPISFRTGPPQPVVSNTPAQRLKMPHQ